MGNINFSCALGRSGLVSRKFEGDGGTPIGEWFFRRVFYRSDRIRRPRSKLMVNEILTDDGWCDEPFDANYNRFVKRPYKARSETLWREDQLYDIIVVLSHNERPRVQRGGSAIFMHVAKPGYPPTEGCIALGVQDLDRVLSHVSVKSSIKVMY